MIKSETSFRRETVKSEIVDVSFSAHKALVTAGVSCL
jgi:hypothetical protein